MRIVSYQQWQNVYLRQSYVKANNVFSNYAILSQDESQFKYNRLPQKTYGGNWLI